MAIEINPVVSHNILVENNLYKFVFWNHSVYDKISVYHHRYVMRINKKVNEHYYDNITWASMLLTGKWYYLFKNRLKLIRVMVTAMTAVDDCTNETIGT